MRRLLNFGFNGLRMITAAAGSFVASVIIARSLGAPEMGTYSFVLWGAATVTSLSSLGLPDAISKYVAQEKGLGNHALAGLIARKIVRTQLVAAALTSLIAAGLWGGFERRQFAVILLALATVLPSALQQTLLALMEGEQRFDLQAIATLGGSLFQIGIVALVALSRPAITGFLAANLISSVVLLGVTYYFCRPMLAIDNAASPTAAFPETVRKAFRFSRVVYGLWLLQLIVFDKSELVFLRVFTARDQLALYSIAFALTARLSTAGDSICYVLFPMFVTRFAETGHEGLRASYRRSITYLQMMMAPLCLWGLLLLPQLIVFAYGQQYAHVVPVIEILLFTLLFSVTMNVSSGVIYALDRQTTIVRSMVAAAVLNLALDMLLIPRYAAVGAAVANGLSQATAALGLVMILRGLLPGSFPVPASAKVYAAAFVASAPIVCADLILHVGPVLLAFSVLCAVPIYGVLLVRMQALTRGELSTLKANIAFPGLRTERG